MHGRKLCVKVWLHCHSLTLMCYVKEKYWGQGKVLFFVRLCLLSSEFSVHCHYWYWNSYNSVNFFTVPNKLLYPDLQLWLGVFLLSNFVNILLFLLLSFLAQYRTICSYFRLVTLTANQLNSGSFVLVSICMCFHVLCASSVHKSAL